MTVIPTETISGEVIAPGSKAHTHRALVAGLLSKGTTLLRNPLSCDDTDATARAIAALGARVKQGPAGWTVEGEGIPRPPKSEIDCGESGASLRFLIPIAAMTHSEVTLTGQGALLRRPLDPLIEAMEQLGVSLSVDRDRVQLGGEVPAGGDVKIQGNISSQFISGLLFAAPLMKKGLRIQLTSRLESRRYVSLTIETLRKHGVNIRSDPDLSSFQVNPGQRYSPASHEIPGDYSSAAFPLAAAALAGSKVVVRGLPANQNTLPDAEFVEILRKMGANVSVNGDRVTVSGGKLRAVDLDIRECPDLGPVTTVLEASGEGAGRLMGAARLRFKESNRLAAMVSELRSLGADIAETDDGLITRGPSRLTGGNVSSHGDHRVAMALAVAAIKASEPVVIEGAECVSKSYPRFFDDLRSLGVGLIG